MKDSKEYSPRLTKVIRSLKRSGEKCTAPSFVDPIEAVVYALISEPTTEAAAARAFKRLKSHFIDLNDLRVSRVEEIQDVLRDVSERAEASARAITQVLNSVFDKTDHISLAGLCAEGKRQAHKELSEIPGITPFAVNYCFLTALGGHAIPLTERMLTFMRDNQLVHPQASLEEIAGFLERQVPAADAYEFYELLRNAIEQGSADIVSAAPAKKAAAKKTSKKKNDKKTK